ncbi:Endonuclease VIII [hydrothermal vent metagenome]|uniref:DNA-(apurinic or apyrimidinic site) lyase n=1 Tax=hydrothermal vent metagenome TaxID=652676 RepID=A0A3B1ALH4_9ZZZZ
MPEGPEIKRAADELAAAITGRKISRIYFAFPRLHNYKKKLLGAKVLEVSSRSKAILTRFDNGLTIYSHNQLYGRWVILPTGDYPASSRTLRLALHTRDKMALLYSASDIDVLKTSSLQQHSYLKKLGIELLHSQTRLNDLILRFEQPRFQRRNLMGLLQDQSFISGVGNYLCCEALHVSCIHPATRLIDLNKKQRTRLAKNCLKLSRQSYTTGGITNQITRAKNLHQKGIAFENYRFHVYRREGLPCYQCETKIEKGKYSGKMGYHCPSCQLADS